jgi:DNA-binding response OmpR family regulator
MHMASGSAAPILLYVEDEPITQDLVEAALREAGFEVLTASDGHEALAQLGAKSGVLRGLITDINLGDCPDGWEVARNARESINGLAVVYVSGACEHEWTAMGVPNSLMIVKPFAPAQIVVAISSLLVASNSTSGQS